MRTTSANRSAILAVVAALSSSSLEVQAGPLSSDPKDDAPVIVTGAALTDFEGTPVDRLGVFRYDPASSSFVPIPFQVDERVDRVFNPGTANQFTERVYDVLHEDDGLLDSIDELVFLFGDASATAAPPGVPWPQGADVVFYEIEIVDPRPGAPDPVRWAYVFVGVGLDASNVRYVTWDLGPASSIVTDTMEIEYQDRWLLTGYRVRQPCGSGADLIDRLKGRAGIFPEQGETEEVWNLSSTYLGGIVGPIRAIRYVRGAASGFNTIHHDLVYPRMWERAVNLRVHPINSVWFYMDWVPQPGLLLYSPTHRAGVPQDGVPDGPSYQALELWNLMSGPAGGYWMYYDVPPSPLYQTIEQYFRDDSAYDDAPVIPPNYGDEDDCAFGNHGARIYALTGSETQAILIRAGLIPLCSQEGDADLADDYYELISSPPLVQAWRRETSTQAVRTLDLWRDLGDVVMSWQAVSGSVGYRVYVSPFPDLPRASWTLLDEVTTTTFRDVGAATGSDRFYSIVPVTGAGEGEW